MHREQGFRILSAMTALEGEAIDTDALVVAEFISGLSSLLLYMQYMGVILIETVQLGLWGKIIGWMSALANLFQLDKSNAIILISLVSIFSYPLAVVYCIKYFLKGKENDLKFDEREKWILFSMKVFLAFDIVLIPTFLLMSSAGGASICFILAIYTFLLITWYVGKNGIFEKPIVIQILRSVLVLLYIPLASIVGEFGSLVRENADALDDPNQQEALTVYRISSAGASVLTLLLLYIIMFEVQLSLVLRNKHFEENRCQTCISCLCCFTCMMYSKEDQAFIDEHLVTNVKPHRWYFSILLLLERFAMSLVAGTLGSVEFLDSTAEIDRRPIIGFIGILSIALFFLICLKPYENVRINRIEIFSRLAHVAIVIVLLLQTEVSAASFQILLFAITIPTFLVWFLILKPKKALEILLRSTEDSMGTIHLAKQRLVWHNAGDMNMVKNILASRKRNKVIQSSEWEILTSAQKVYLICAIPEPIVKTQLSEQILHLNTYNQVLMNSGTWCLNQVKVLDLRNSKVDNAMCGAFSEESFFRLLPVLEEVILSNNMLYTAEGFEVILNAISESRSLKTLRIRESHLTSKYISAIALFLGVSSIEVLDLAFNRLASKGVSNLLQILQNNVSLKVLHLEENFVDSFSKGVLLALSKANINEIYFDKNFLSSDNLIQILKHLNLNSVTTIGLSSQKDPALIEAYIDSTGEILTSETDFQTAISRYTTNQSFTPSIVRNEMAKFLETAPNLHFSPIDNSLRSCLVLEKVFDLELNVIVGLSKSMWLNLMKGICCFFSSAIANLSSEHVEQVKKVINVSNKRGITVAELVLEFGVSHVPDTLDVLFKLEADFEIIASSGDKLIEIASNHNHKEVREWCQHYLV